MKHKSSDTLVPDELLKSVVEFHGHLGPFLVLGVKAGLLANSMLGKDYFETTAVITTDPSPPNSCFVDGIQFTTGCTMGKGNIKLRRGKGVSVLFSRGNRKIRLRLKRNMLGYVKSISSEKASKDASLSLLGKAASELFEIERLAT